MLLIVEREVAKQVDKLVQERVAECLKTHIIPQELQDEVAISEREPPQRQASPRLASHPHDSQTSTMAPPPPPQMHQHMWGYYVS
jgi:hypothetical protein